MPSQPGTLEILSREIATALRPLEQQLVAGRFVPFMAELGLQLPDSVANHASVASGVVKTISSVSSLIPLIVSLQAAIEAEDTAAMAQTAEALLRQLYETFTGISDLSSGISSAAGGLSPAERASIEAFAEALPRRLLDYVVIEYIRNARPAVLRVLNLTGLVDDFSVPMDPADPLSSPSLRRSIHFERFLDLFTQPELFLNEVYHWGDPAFDGLRLFERIHSFLSQYDLPVTIIRVPGELPVLEAYFLRFEADQALSPPGLTMRMRFPAISDFERNYRLTDLWVLHLAVLARFETGLELKVQPPLSITFKPPSGSADVEIRGGLSAEKESGPMVLLGRADGNGLFLQSAGMDLGLKGAWSLGSSDVLVEPSISAQLRGGQLKVDLSESDGFIQGIISGVKIDANLELGMHWSPSTGVSFEGSSTIEIAIPTHVTLGPIEIQTIYLISGLDAEGTVPVELSGAFSVNLGPLQASVDRIGLAAKLSFPDEGEGNLGMANLAFDFKPPNGVGLAIDAAVVKGGGYLFFDFDKEEYAGILELDLNGIVSVKAIGLITTKMPDGSKGFSLLLIITAEFGSPIQLSFGFTLSGVGGLLGLNRTMRLEVIASGIRDGGINSVMFPQNVIENAPRIISDLKKYFPVEEGTFLIGPMVKIGWGTPNLVTVSLGVIIEIPGNIAILGVLKVALPDEDAALIVIQVNFMGAIEFDKKRLWFFAAIFESRVLFITLEGEMGLLVGWGDDASFVVSVGGFHPAFNPPALPFGSIARIAISILNTSFARIRVEGYFAVTSNSVQFGAKVEIYFGVSAFNIDGHLAFDALFRFSPFYFIISISASLSVKVFGIGLFSVRMRGSLEGPTPWRVEGTGSISILFFDIDVDFSHTWGNEAETTLPPISVMPLLMDEFQKMENWQAVLPDSNQLLISLREFEQGTIDLVLHPVGSLKISQRAVPLGMTIDKVGNQKPVDANHFEVTVDTSGIDKKGKVEESFAVGQYFAKSDNELLKSKSFEPMQGGVELAVEGEQYSAPKAVKRIVRYEKTIIDTNYKRFVTHFFAWFGSLFGLFLGGNAVSKSALSFKQKKLHKPFDDKVEVAANLYVVALNTDNTAFSEESVAFTSQAQAQDFMKQQITGDANLDKQLHVIPHVEMQEAA